MILKLKNIKEFLINYHKKLKLYNFNKYNLYLNALLLKLYNFNNNAFRYKKIKYNINYIYIYSLKKKKINIYKDIKFKHIIYENYKNYEININNIDNNYFKNNYYLKLLLPINFSLKINLWYYILYNKYIFYLSIYLYNLILKLNYINIRYPLLLLLVRSIVLNRLNKIKKLNKNKYSINYFNIKFKIIYTKNKILKKLIIQNIQNIKIILKNKNIKILFLLSNYDIFKNISYIWLNSSKIILLYNNYFNIINNINLSESNKLNILGLYSLYWQISKYGFNYEYYTYNTNIYKIINIKNNIKNFNYIYYKLILLLKKKLVLIIWFKIINIIILNYINKIFYKYNSKFKLNKFNRYIYRKYLTRVISNYVFKFKPIKLNMYYNIKYIKKNINIIKNNLDYICNTYLFKIKYNKIYRYNISILNIIDKINLDIKINNNIYFLKNIYYYLLKKVIIKYYFMNWFDIIININNFNKKLYNKLKKNDITNFNDYLLIKNNSYNMYNKLYSFYNIRYIWNFEKSLIYNLYIIYINIYYKLYILKIYLYKKI